MVDLLGQSPSPQTKPWPKNNRGRQATRAGLASLCEGAAQLALPAEFTPSGGTLLGTGSCGINIMGLSYG